MFIKVGVSCFLALTLLVTNLESVVGVSNTDDRGVIYFFRNCTTSKDIRNIIDLTGSDLFDYIPAPKSPFLWKKAKT